MGSEPPLPQRATGDSGLVAAVVPPLVAAGLAVVARLQPLRSADILWQIRSGEEILRRHGRVPVDLYSRFFRGRPIHDHEAAFEAVVAWLHRAGGMRGLWFVTLVLAVAVIALATHAARRLVPSAPARIIGATAVIAFIAARSELRAELATFAAIGIAHALRRRANDDDVSGRALALRLSPIAAAAVAAPFHGLAWWTALVPLAHAAAALLERRRARVAFDVVVAVLCCVAVAIASPGVFALNVESVGGSAIIEHINELRTPLSLLLSRSNALPAVTQVATAIALVGLFRLRKTTARTSDVVLFAVLIIPGLRYARFASLPFLAMMPWGIGGVAALVNLGQRFRSLAVGVPMIAAAMAILSMTAELGLDYETVGFAESTQPVTAVAYLRATRPNAVLFHPYNFGPYLIFSGYPPGGVVIDPRAQMVYPNDHVRRYYDATSDPVVFERWVDEARFDTVLLSRHHLGTRPLRDYLERSPLWREVHEDLVAIVYVRR